MRSLKAQKHRVKLLKQMIFEKEHNMKQYKRAGILNQIKLSDNCPDLYKELEKEKETLKSMEACELCQKKDV